MSRHVVLVGGGYAGLTAARRLRRRLPRDVRVTVVNPHPYMTYQPLLPETAGGTVAPHHVVVPLRSALRGADLLVGSLTGLDPERRVATVTTAGGNTTDLLYDELVLATGSMTRTLPVPGLLEHAVGFRTVEEALHLRHQVLARLEVAAATTDPQVRRRALTFVFVGAGYAGVEAIAEVEDMVRRVLRGSSGLHHAETRWVLVEGAERILGQLPERLASYVADRLRGRGVDVRTGTVLSSVESGRVRLSDGSSFAADTVVWTAGVVASPLLRRLGLDVDRLGRVRTDPQLRVRPGVWALGDCAGVPDVHTGGACPPTAQHAVRQAARLADNLVRHLGGRPLRPYRHRDAGAVASLGLGQGVAELYGVPLRGYPAWLVHRVYHGSRLPCGRRRLMVVLDWVLGPSRAEPVSLAALERPRAPLRDAHREQAAG
jgi:NADH dehydrogenase